MVNDELKNHRLESTPNGKVLLALSCVLFLEAYLFTNLIPALSATAIILYLVYIKLNIRDTIRNFDADIERTTLKKKLFANKSFNIVLKIKNNSSIAQLEIEDKIPKGCLIHKGTNKYSTLISPDREYKFKYSIYAKERGHYIFKGVRVTLKDKRKLFQYTMDWVLASDIRVQCDIDTIKKVKAIAKKEKLELTAKTRDYVTMTSGYEFKSIRDYIPGDRLKDIEWKTTSKLSKLMTKEFEKETAILSIILLDCSKSMRKTTGGKSKINHGIQLSLQLTKMFSTWKHPIGLIAFDEHKVLSNITPSTSYGQFDRIFNTLLYMPNQISISEYGTNLPIVPLPPKTESEERFVGTIAPFLTKRRRTYKSITQITGIYEAIRILTSTTERGKFILLITDLETNLYSLHEALKLAKKYENKIVLITLFTYWYNSHEGRLTPDLLETIYRSYVEKQKIIKKLRRLRVKVIELSPQDVGRKIIRELERKTR